MTVNEMTVKQRLETRTRQVINILDSLARLDLHQHDPDDLNKVHDALAARLTQTMATLRKGPVGFTLGNGKEKHKPAKCHNRKLKEGDKITSPCLNDGVRSVPNFGWRCEECALSIENYHKEQRFREIGRVRQPLT